MIFALSPDTHYKGLITVGRTFHINQLSLIGHTRHQAFSRNLRCRQSRFRIRLLNAFRDFYRPLRSRSSRIGTVCRVLLFLKSRKLRLYFGDRLCFISSNQSSGRRSEASYCFPGEPSRTVPCFKTDHGSLPPLVLNRDTLCDRGQSEHIPVSSKTLMSTAMQSFLKLRLRLHVRR